jgi:N-acetyl-anhydromuramyl-L-alanine amidase AmpD
MKRSHAFLGLGLGIITFGCVPEGRVEAELDVELGPEIQEDSSLAALFAEAEDTYGVPQDLMKALAFMETRLEPADGTIEFDDQPEPFGLFGLAEARLSFAAELAGVSLEEAMTDDRANIFAAAALLSYYGALDAEGTSSREGVLGWRGALERWAGVEPELSKDFATDVFGLLREGMSVPTLDGSTLVINRYAIGQVSQGLGASGATWQASPNHSSRNGRPVELVVIHTCEGAYAGCVSTLRNPNNRVSAHYVISENGQRLAQLVDENRKAWHISARYRKALNSGQLAAYDNVPANEISIGIEHAGRAAQSSWPESQITRSIDLVREITARHNIPRDRYHIVGHGQLQPETRTDPGRNWPWTSYLARINGTASSGGTTQTGGGTTQIAPSPSIITVDNGHSGRFRASASWQPSSWASGKVGADYRFRAPQFTSDLAEFKLSVPETGRWEVFVRAPGNGYNNDIPFFVRHAGGETTVRRSFKSAGAAWVSLGTFSFAEKDDWIVAVSCWTGGRGYIVADAVKLERR